MQRTDIGHGRGWLRADAAASIRRIDHALGRPLDSNSAGRTAAEQAEARRKFFAGGPYAAPVGTSPHEFGTAIDTDDRFIALMADHGWSRPLKTEPWHFVYNPTRDNHRYEGVPAALPLTEEPTPEEEEMATTIPLTLIRTEQHGCYTVTPGACIAHKSQKVVQGVPYREWGQVMDVHPDDLADFIFALSGAPYIPAGGTAWFATPTPT